MKIKVIEILVVIAILLVVGCILAASPGAVWKAENDVSEHNIKGYEAFDNTCELNHSVNCDICEPLEFPTEKLHQKYHTDNSLDTFEVAYVDTLKPKDCFSHTYHCKCGRTTTITIEHEDK